MFLSAGHAEHRELCKRLHKLQRAFIWTRLTKPGELIVSVPTEIQIYFELNAWPHRAATGRTADSAVQSAAAQVSNNKKGLSETSWLSLVCVSWSLALRKRTTWCREPFEVIVSSNYFGLLANQWTVDGHWGKQTHTWYTLPDCWTIVKVGAVYRSTRKRA